MQIRGLHRNLYRLAAYATRQESLSTAAQAREKQLGDWETLKARKVPDHEIARVTGISRATYYRRKKALERYGSKGLEARSCRPGRVRTSRMPQANRDAILRVRQAHPTYGKAKIAAILKREYGLPLSESAVGRVLSNLMRRGLVARYAAAARPRRKRRFTGHAKRWAYDLRPTQPGEMIQVDHMTVTKNQCSFKHFQAWDPITKTTHAEVYGNAKSSTAAAFLKSLQEALPFAVKSIQVDGGSEFMKDFEEACKIKGIPLYVLPPKRPQYNGGVERMNRTMREDFYARKDLHADSLGAFRHALKHALHTYNHFRPHQHLDNLTPAQYTQNILRPNLSHRY